jgi:CheY-like chemotaxis protein
MALETSGRTKILLVDDNQSVRSFVRPALEIWPETTLVSGPEGR